MNIQNAEKEIEITELQRESLLASQNQDSENIQLNHFVNDYKTVIVKLTTELHDQEKKAKEREFVLEEQIKALMERVKIVNSELSECEGDSDAKEKRVVYALVNDHYKVSSEL